MKRSATLFDFAFSGGGSKKKKEDGKELKLLFLWEGRELPPFFNGREGMTFFENPRLSSDVGLIDLITLVCVFVG